MHEQQRKPKRKVRRVYLTSKKAHEETMKALAHMHTHQLEILKGIQTIMTAHEDLKREMEEMKASVAAILVKVQELIATIAANPGNEKIVTDAVAELDALQKQIEPFVAPAADPDVS